MALIVAGSLNLDLVGQAPRIPAAGETVLGSTLRRFHGGKGGNQAVAAARAAASVRFAGAVGDDAAGAELCDGLRAEGIDVSAVVRTPEPTGAALITVADSGQNAITVLPGANRLAPMPSSPWPADVRWLLLQLEIPMATCLAWATAARAAGARVLLNAAPVAELPQALLSTVDLLLVNEGEARALASGCGVQISREPPEETRATDGSLCDLLQALSARGPATVVATLGARGCLAWARDAGGWIEQPACPVAVVDTTGAGDTFTGVLAAFLDGGADLRQALLRATVAAGMSCRVEGARRGMPSREAIERDVRGWPADGGDGVSEHHRQGVGSP